MLEINKETDGEMLRYKLAGRLDTSTAPELEEEVKGISEDVKELEFDFANVDYISSAGLRVLLAAQKLMNKQGEMKVTNVNETISEIFEVTGFSEILTVE